MRHGKKFNHLGRTPSHRKAMLSNMASSLIVHKRINTTLAKAKELGKYVEPLITRSKADTTHSRRSVFRYLQDKQAVTELFRDVSGKIGDRPGGYTRIIKLGNRLGDQAEMAMIELVDYNDLLVKDAKPAKAKRSRRGKKSGGAKKAAAAAVATEEVVEDAVEEATEEVETKSEAAAEDVKEEKDEKKEDKKSDKEDKEED